VRAIKPNNGGRRAQTSAPRLAARGSKPSLYLPFVSEPSDYADSVRFQNRADFNSLFEIPRIFRSFSGVPGAMERYAGIDGIQNMSRVQVNTLR
jgi:hypothetical protein